MVFGGPVDPNHPIREEMDPPEDPSRRLPPAWQIYGLIIGLLFLAMLAYSLFQQFTD
jgi:hypothetical protein